MSNVQAGVKNGPYDYRALAQLSYQELRDAICMNCQQGFWPEDWYWNLYLAAGGDPSIAPHDVGDGAIGDHGQGGTPEPTPSPTPTPGPTPSPTPPPATGSKAIVMCQFKDLYGQQPVGQGDFGSTPSATGGRWDVIASFRLTADHHRFWATGFPNTFDSSKQRIWISRVPGGPAEGRDIYSTWVNVDSGLEYSIGPNDEFYGNWESDGPNGLLISQQL